MPAPALSIWLPRYLIPYASRLFATQRGRSGPLLRMGRFTPTLSSAYRASSYSVVGRYSRARHNWNRIKIPLYGSPLVNIPGQRVLVPAGTQFVWSNPDELYEDLPQISFRPMRGTAAYGRLSLPSPGYEMVVRKPPARGYGRKRPEATRRRKDAKLDFGINRLYALVNRTYGRADEYLDFISAFQNNRTPLAVATQLAINEAVDYSYGARAQALRKNIYSNPDYWRLPVGFDVISRIWR